MRKYFFWCSLLATCFLKTSGQDPHFSQFFMVPQFINPAQIGNFEGSWRLMGNFRQQWGLAETPFTTAVGAYEMKLLGKEEGDNTLALGGAFMYDHSMFSAFKSNYLVANIAYHVQLSENTDRISTLGIGYHGMYASRRIDYSALTFGEQFTDANGFAVGGPSGEANLTQPRPYYSMGTGLMYNYKTPDLSFGVGASAFHLNRPRQSFLGDKDWVIPMRYVGHANFGYNLPNSSLSLNFNSIFQYQAKPSYFAVGAALGMDISDDKVLYAGGWFREGDAFYPYVGFLANKVQLGFTYDITHSKQNQGPVIPQSLEMSFIISGEPLSDEIKRVKCPW